MASRLKKLIPSRLTRHTKDATTLVKEYLVQETVGPLRSLKRLMLFGTLGSFLVGTGVLFLLVGLLRLLQSQGALQGHLSWLPYLMVAVVALGVAGTTGALIASGAARRRRKKEAEP